MTQLDLFADAAEQEPIPATFAATPKPKTHEAAAEPPRPEQERPVKARPVRTLPRGLSDPYARALAIGEAVAATWHRQHGGTAIEVPIGVVAALSLIRQKDPQGPDLTAQILSQDGPQLIGVLREIWSMHWIHRPDLIDRARVLHEWLNEEVDEQRVYVVRAVTKTALDRGLFDLTAHEDPYLRSATDVLSPVMMCLRSKGAQQGLGEYHTPPSAAEAMAEMVAAGSAVEMGVLAGETRAGQHIHDPAGGSGGLLRAAAQVIRERGQDPCDFQWSMCDIDEIAAACGAVNAIIWNLGPRVTVACDNSLANPNAVEDAWKQAQAVIKHRDEMLGKARIIAAIREAQQLLERSTAVAA